MSLFPTDVSDPSGLVFERRLFSIEIQAHAFLGREFQQTLKNLNLELGGLRGEDIKRKISKHSMLGHFLKKNQVDSIGRCEIGVLYIPDRK